MRLPTYLLLLLSLLLVSPAISQTLTQVLNLDIHSNPLGIASVGNTVYLTGTSYKIEAYDVSQPAQPVLLSSTIANVAYPRQVTASSMKAYVWGIGLGNATSSDLRVFDISRPQAPVAGDKVVLGKAWQYVANTDALVAVATSYDDKLSVYDSKLNLLSSVNKGRGTEQLVITGTTLYVSGYGTVEVYDLANPAALVRSTLFTGSIIAVSGTLAFGLDGNTLLVYDITNPLQPVLKGSTSNNKGTLLAASGNRVYTTGQYSEINGSTSQLQVFDVSNPAAPTLLATAAANSTAVALTANGNAAYLVDGHYLKVFTLSGALAATTSAPTLLDEAYPNPAHGILTFSQVPAATLVTLFDATGRVCLQATLPATHMLDVSGLPRGVYTARIGNAARKVVLY